MIISSLIVSTVYGTDSGATKTELTEINPDFPCLNMTFNEYFDGAVGGTVPCDVESYRKYLMVFNIMDVFCADRNENTGTFTAYYHTDYKYAWLDAYYPYEQVFTDGNPYYNRIFLEKITIHMYSGVNPDMLNKAFSEWNSDPKLNSDDFEYLNLTEDNYFRTGSIIRYTGPDAHKYPFDLQVVVQGDIVGGEDGLGDGKTDILDLVKMRSVIVSGQNEEFMSNLILYRAFKCSPKDLDYSYVEPLDIVDIVKVRSLIVNGYY